MKKLSKNEVIAVFASMGMLAYLFFSGPFMSLFNTNVNVEGQNSPANLPASGVSIEDTAPGTGETAAPGDELVVHYTGILTSGQVFDSSRDRGEPISFVLGTGRVIRGWDEGLVGMREGGRRILKIAPDYGYGSNAVGAIPPNSHILFEVELIDVKKPQ